MAGVGKNHYAFITSYERDDESGTDYAVNRNYASAVGRFTRTDPAGGSYRLEAPQSLNRYSYVGNSSVDLTDPLGLEPWSGWFERSIAGWTLCIMFPRECDGRARDPGGRSGGGAGGDGSGFQRWFPPFTPPQGKCEFRFLLDGPPAGRYPTIGRIPDFDPNTHNHGKGVSADNPTRWFYYYEVLFIGDLNVIPGWTIKQIAEVPRGYFVLDLGGGRRERINFPAIARHDDSPDTGAIAGWGPFGYLFFDAPSAATRQVGSDGNRILFCRCQSSSASNSQLTTQLPIVNAVRI